MRPRTVSNLPAYLSGHGVARAPQVRSAFNLPFLLASSWAIGAAVRARPPTPSPLPPVLTGHVSSLLPYYPDTPAPPLSSRPLCTMCIALPHQQFVKRAHQHGRQFFFFTLFPSPSVPSTQRPSAPTRPPRRRAPPCSQTAMAAAGEGRPWETALKDAPPWETAERLRPKTAEQQQQHQEKEGPECAWGP
jgi:hypothetical protein